MFESEWEAPALLLLMFDAVNFKTGVSTGLGHWVPVAGSCIWWKKLHAKSHLITKCEVTSFLIVWDLEITKLLQTDVNAEANFKLLSAWWVNSKYIRSLKTLPVFVVGTFYLKSSTHKFKGAARLSGVNRCPWSFLTNLISPVRSPVIYREFHMTKKKFQIMATVSKFIL